VDRGRMRSMKKELLGEVDDEEWKLCQERMVVIYSDSEGIGIIMMELCPSAGWVEWIPWSAK